MVLASFIKLLSMLFCSSSFNNLYSGTYLITEEEAPEGGYVKIVEPNSVTISEEDEETKEVTIENLRRSLIINKLAQEGGLLKGAAFTVKYIEPTNEYSKYKDYYINNSGEISEENYVKNSVEIENSTGKLEFNQILPGTYLIEETKTPNDDFKPYPGKEITISDRGESSVVVEDIPNGDKPGLQIKV